MRLNPRGDILRVAQDEAQQAGMPDRYVELLGEIAILSETRDLDNDGVDYDGVSGRSTAIREAVNNYSEYNESMLDAALTIYHDFYGRSGAEEWAQAMVKCGIYGVLHSFDQSETQHLVVYDPRIIEVIQEEPYRKIENNPGLPLAVANEYGVHFETGIPVTFRFIRSVESAPYMGSRYQQDIEPSGLYMLHNPDPGDLGTFWVAGTAHFSNPLVLAFNTGDYTSYDEHSWKAILTKHFKAKGKRLTTKLLQKGYDGIVTVGQDGAFTKEIVSLGRNIAWDVEEN